MKNLLKSKKALLFCANAAGMVSGFALGVIGACAYRRCMSERNSLKSKAKRAFRTIEETLSM